MINAIKNKQESDYALKSLGLNRMDEVVFTKSTLGNIKAFLDSHKHPYYNIRDKSTSEGKFLYKITADEVVSQAKNYKQFSIYESLALADEKLILQGEIEITTDFELTASLSDIKCIPNRVAMQTPKFTVCIDLKEKREPSIRGLSSVIDYIIVHELFGAVVEFSMFGIPVGVANENILIWELRNY